MGACLFDLYFLPQDITDYDDVRYCCTGADVCLDCWPLMTVAIKVIDASLRGRGDICFPPWSKQTKKTD